MRSYLSPVVSRGIDSGRIRLTACVADDIDALAAAAYAQGDDAFDVAVDLIATMLEARD